MQQGFMRGALMGMTVTAVVAIAVSMPGAQPASGGARPARIDGHPNLSGIWQTNNEANWDLQAHEARAGAVMQEGVYRDYDAEGKLVEEVTVAPPPSQLPVTLWLGPQAPHSVHNLDSRPTRLLRVELK